uniref:PKD domain-containing protein n=1 Tax=Macrostomum lignano TaxID=282301 RepID=A0A1I8F2G9_9PLAT
MCPASNDSCFITEQTVYQALVQNPIFNATLLASSTQLRTPTTIFAELPKADVSASARFPVTIRAVDVDEQASISQHFTVPISNQLTDSSEIPFTTPEAEEHKTKSYKVYYPISAQLSLELNFANNTPGYYPVMEEFQATIRISLGSNMSTIFNFGDGTAKQFSNLPDTFPVTYRRSVAFNESNDAIWTDPEHSVTVFSSFRIDSNITITTVVPLVRPVAQPATIAVLALRPVCSSGSVYCNRANACTNNCSALPGARSVACGSGSAWSTNRRICRSGSAQDSSLFADGYYVHQSVAANLTSPSASHYFQTVYLPGGGLSLIPGDLLALYDPNGAVACENSTLTEVNLNETEHLLSWNTSFADFTLDGATVRRVTLATLNSGARRSVKAVQFFGNRQLSCWATIASPTYCNDEYPFNITASIVSGVDGQTAVSKLPLIVQIPLINVTFEAPLYYTSHTKVPYQIGSHSGSKPVYSWSVNASLTDFNSSMLANSGYSFASDGFYNVCLTTVNHVSSFFVCHTVIIQHPLLNDTTFIVPDLLLATTPTSPALSTIYFTWNASNSDVPTNVSAIIDPADGGNPVFVLVDWSTSRRVVEYKRNYSRGVYIRKIEMFNQVSRQVSNTSLVVQEAIMGPVLTASAYVVRPGQVVTYTLNLVWGSDYTVTINFGDGNSQTVTVNDNNHTTTFTHTSPVSATTPPPAPSSTAVTAQLDRTVVEVMFVPAGFELLASFIKLLRRPENMTDTRLQLCRNSTINALEPLYSVFYDIDLGDGSLAATGIALVSCDTSNTANNDACTGQFGPGFVHCQFAPTQQYRHPGNFTATVRLYNKAGSQTLTWSQQIYSQIVNLNRNITLYPGMYTGNTPVHDMSRTYAYPIEHPLKFFAITQFGHLSPLYYNWDFGDGHTAVTTVNWIEHKFDKPLLFTVRVNVTNPLVWQADSYNIELKRSVIDVTIGAKVAMPMDYPYEVTMDFAAFPTNTCFIIDFSNFGTRVVNNGSKHMFGFEAFCNSDPYFSSRKSQCYWDTELTDYYLNGYLESLTGSAFSRTTFFKNFENYGAETVTLHAANSFSSLDYSWTMTVSKGFCSIPVPNLAARFTKTRYKRNQVVEIGGDMKKYLAIMSVRTLSGQSRSLTMALDSGRTMAAFYTKHRSSENLQNLLEGDWFGPTNIHLRLLTLPAFSLRFSKAYRVCAQLTMNDEPTINATECVTFYVYKAPVEPCLQFKYSKDNITWNDLEDPAQAPYGSLLSFDASCSVNPNKFDADGELPCWSVATYCRHDCEPMKFGPNYAYNASEQTLACKKLKIDGGYVHESTCFISQALVTWHYLKPMGLEDWMKVNVTTSSYPNEVVKGVYDRIPGWKDQAAIGKYNFLYYMHNGIVYVDTKFSFEGDAIHFTLVIKDTCDDLLPEPVSATLKITRGEPPIVSGVCVSNCFRRKIPHKKLNGNACGYKSISVNPKVVTKFQMRIENYVAGIDYGFFWQCTPLNSSLKVCPSDLSSTALDDGFNQMELDNKYWTQKDGVEYASTGRTSSGLSIDPPNFFPEGDGYYIIRLRAWRGSDSTNYGFKFLYISVNQGPNASKISTSIYPANGESMKTKFFFTCSYPPSTTEGEHMIYTVGYSFEQTPTKRADCYPLILSE